MKAITKAAVQLIISDVQQLTGEKEVFPTAKDNRPIYANLSFVLGSLNSKHILWYWHHL